MQQAGYYGIPRSVARQQTEKYLRKMGLWEKRATGARMLSGGMKRRLMIARALVHEPKLLILDEPTAGVDIDLRRATWSLLEEINEQGTTVILTTHYLEEAEVFCRRIAIIDRGHIIEDTDKKSLLAKLNIETFVFDLESAAPAGLFLDGFTHRLTDATTLEVDVSKERSLNAVFAMFSKPKRQRGVDAEQSESAGRVVCRAGGSRKSNQGGRLSGRPRIRRTRDPYPLH